jgi:RNA polymerase sigma factor (TIGR02999 family)
MPGPRREEGARCLLTFNAVTGIALGSIIPSYVRVPCLPVISGATILDLMNDVTRILCAVEEGDRHAAAHLLPLVYDELRKLAAGHMANEAPGHTLDATALVHEAYLRLVGPVGERPFANRDHFFAAGAEAMRRILVDSARRRKARRRGAGLEPSPADIDRLPAPAAPVDADSWVDVDDALCAFEKIDSSAAALAKLRIFGGLSVEEAAEALNLSRATAFRTWTYARARLTAALTDKSENP